jgi:nucleotide-binding universal stress UspA family protein
MKVLIGYDGSDGARAAIDDLPRAGLPEGVHARVVSVADVFPHLTSEFFDEEHSPVRETSQLVRQARALARHAMQEAKTLAAEGQALVNERFPKWEIQSDAIGDSPYWALVKEANSWKADLVVVGAHGRNLLTRALIGGVSAQTIAYAPCSIRVGRAPHAKPVGEPLNLVVGIDFSTAAEGAVNHVLARKWPADTTVTLVTALDSQVITALAMIADLPETADEESAVLDRLHRIADRLVAAGFKTESFCARGNPRKILLREAERLQTDCIFVGAKGLSRVKHILIGSVATSIANRATCSVEVTR